MQSEVKRIGRVHLAGELARRGVRGGAGLASERGSPAKRAHIGEALAATWPMVTASYTSLLALVLARLAGPLPSRPPTLG